MKKGIDRRWGLIGFAAAILAVQIAFPTKATAVWPPLLFVMAAVLMYRHELRRYDWRALYKKPFLESVFLAATQGIIAQAAGIAVVQYGLGINEPAVPFAPDIGVILSAVLCSAILEELVYRKSVFGLLHGRLRFWPAAAVSSVLFAAAHANYSAALGYALLGLVWCRAYQKTGTIAVPIAAHMIFNAIAFLVMHVRG